MSENEIEGRPNEAEEPALHGPIEVEALPLNQSQEPPPVTLSGTEVVALLRSVLDA